MTAKITPKEYKIDDIRVIETVPPVYQAILDSGLNPTPQAVYTYGNTIYVPSGNPILEEILEHEKVHIKQQTEMDKDKWWERFLTDEYFRIEQEVEAYAVQYRFMCNKYKDRNHRDKILRNYGGTLGSPTYGSVIGGMKAMQMIRDKANVK